MFSGSMELNSIEHGNIQVKASSLTSQFFDQLINILVSQDLILKIEKPQIDPIKRRWKIIHHVSSNHWKALHGTKLQKI